jgi:hypothetical protein
MIVASQHRRKSILTPWLLVGHTVRVPFPSLIFPCGPSTEIMRMATFLQDFERRLHYRLKRLVNAPFRLWRERNQALSLSIALDSY